MQNMFCLAFVDTSKKEWKCINRKVLELNKPSAKTGQTASFHASVKYRIPFPGTFCVIQKPIDGLMMDFTWDNAENTKGRKHSQAAIITLIMFIAVIMVCVYGIDLTDKLKNSRIARNVERYKWNLVTNTCTDYTGQTAIQK